MVDPARYPHLIPYGDSALLAVLGDALDPAINDAVHALATRLSSPALPGLGVSIPAYASLLIPYDPLVWTADEATALVGPHLTASTVPAADQPLALNAATPVEVPTRYGGKDGPDLAEVAAYHGCTPGDIVRRHTAAVYRVYMLGFAPGFAYLGPLPRDLVTPRRATPRPRVPAGSVGLAGAQTGVYPLATPGGWQIIGRTDLVLWDARRDPPTLLAPGAWVRFVDASGET